MSLIDIILLTIVSAWFLAEIFLRIFSKKNIKANLDDPRFKYFMIFSRLTIVVGIFFGWFAKANNIYIFFSSYYLMSYIGTGLILIGILVRWSAILTLRNYFTLVLTIQNNHHLVRKGLYRLVRHPAYLGIILILTGTGIYLANWLSGIIIIIPYLIAISIRINEEEKKLKENFGGEFEEYRNRTKLLIPFIY